MDIYIAIFISKDTKIQAIDIKDCINIYKDLLNLPMSRGQSGSDILYR